MYKTIIRFVFSIVFGLFLFLSVFGQCPVQSLSKDLADFSNGKALQVFFESKPPGVAFKAWNIIKSSPDPRISALATDVAQLEKFTDIVRSNNLGLDEVSLGDLMNAKTATKNLPWEHPDKVLDAVKRASDANIDGVTILGFPTPSEGNTSFVLANAKQYQLEASQDALLSFNKGGRSFDNVTSDGVLIDREYGHGNSVFNSDLSVKDLARRDKIVQTANDQIEAANGTPIRWEVSTGLGADGIQKLFDDLGIDIKVDWVKQDRIISI